MTDSANASALAVCTCPSGDGSLRWPCPKHAAEAAARADASYLCSALGALFSGDTLDDTDASVIDRARKLIRSAVIEPAPGPALPFQSRVQPWMLECFGAEIAGDMIERGDRFLEESLELLQSHGYDRARIATLVDYVWSRPIGEPEQEVGGVMVTLAAYCLAADLDMHAAGETELARILQPEVIEKIRRKQAGKNGMHTPLPVPPAPAVATIAAEDIGWCEDIAESLQEAGGSTNSMRLVALRRAIAALRGTLA